MATIEQIKELRDKTGAGVNAVREALDKHNNDVEKAIIYLRQQGIAKAEKRAAKDASEGIFGTYVHNNNKVVVIVEINTETDFAAKGEDVQEFAQDIALHIAAVSPNYITIESIDPAALEKEKKVYSKELEGKPEEVQAKILEGKLSKFYEANVLMKQTLFSDESKTVEDYLNELVAKVGEKIQIKQFHKFEVAKETISNSAK